MLRRDFLKTIPFAAPAFAQAPETTVNIPLTIRKPGRTHDYDTGYVLKSSRPGYVQPQRFPHHNNPSFWDFDFEKKQIISNLLHIDRTAQPPKDYAQSNHYARENAGLFARAAAEKTAEMLTSPAANELNPDQIALLRQHLRILNEFIKFENAFDLERESKYVHTKEEFRFIAVGGYYEMDAKEPWVVRTRDASREMEHAKIDIKDFNFENFFATVVDRDKNQSRQINLKRSTDPLLLLCARAASEAAVERLDAIATARKLTLNEQTAIEIMRAYPWALPPEPKGTLAMNFLPQGPQTFDM